MTSRHCPLEDYVSDGAALTLHQSDGQRQHGDGVRSFRGAGCVAEDSPLIPTYQFIRSQGRPGQQLRVQIITELECH
jgi:hypothetical protein